MLHITLRATKLPEQEVCIKSIYSFISNALTVMILIFYVYDGEADFTVYAQFKKRKTLSWL